MAALTVVAAVLGGQGGAYRRGELTPPSPAVDRIAYVSLDGEILTVRPDGSGAATVSPEDGFFTWPTWSPDGRRLAFSGVVNRDSDRAQSLLYSLNTLTGRLSELHSGEPGFRGLVTDGAPHYTLWSPDGSHLAFLGTTDEGQVLYLDNLFDRDGARVAMSGAPLYLDWSPDSGSLLVHLGPDHFLLDADGGAPARLGVDSDGVLYRAPKWDRAGSALTLVTGQQGVGYTLYALGIDAVERSLTGDMKPVVRRVPRSAAFLWSPDGRHIAVTVPDSVLFFEPLGLLVYRRLNVVRDDGSGDPVGIGANVVAFFWSPDSSRLAYVSLAEDLGSLQWNILEVASGESWPLARFFPSADQLTVFRFFDQYASSHSLWSPDSQSLVFAGRVAASGFSASTRQQPGDQIIVTATYASPSPRIIADGRLAFWSPR